MLLMLAAFGLSAATPLPPPGGAARPLIAPAQLDDTLEITGEGVAARQMQSRMAVPVMVQGQGPFRFVVDSGADRSVIGARLASRLALPRRRPAMVHGMAGSSLTDTVLIERLTVGTAEIENIVAPALEEADLGADGLLGIDALAEQRLMLDFDRKTVTIQDSRKAETPAASDEIVVTARRRRGQLILTEARVRGTMVSAVIDTGAQISVGNSALRARLYRSKRAPERKITLMSVTGASVEAELLVLQEVTIGRLTLYDLPIAFVDAPPFALFGLADQPAMLLGTDLLEAFSRVSLDFRRRKVRFTLRR